MISKNKTIQIVDNFETIKDFFKKSQYTFLCVLVDENTKSLALPFLLESFKDEIKLQIFEVKSGEENKNIPSCLNIWHQLSDLNVDRKSLLINLGGGVLCDMGGFISATYKRGIDCVNIPTTLLSMVDASIGGKTGVNIGVYKNQIGHFSQPKAVFINTEFLNTLPEKELVNGYAEIIKHALICDLTYWNTLKKNGFINLNEIISKSIEIKYEIVSQDPLEKNIRKKLNFGHTIGHALEMLSPKLVGRQLSHGEAVAIGIICESYISMKLSGFKEKELLEITDFIKTIFPAFKINTDHFQKIFDLMLFDKKNENGKIKMVLLKSIGKAVIDIEAEREMIFNALEFYNGVM